MPMAEIRSRIRFSIGRSLSFTQMSPNRGPVLASPAGRACGGHSYQAYQRLRGTGTSIINGHGPRSCINSGRGVRVRTIVVGLVSCFALWLLVTKASSSSSASASALPVLRGGIGKKGRSSGNSKRYSKLLQSVGDMPPTSLTTTELQTINDELDRMDLGQVLEWAISTFGKRLVDVTSFGYSGMVILHKLRELGLLERIPVVTIDTLHLFDETYSFIEQVRKQLSISTFVRYAPKDYDQRAGFDEAYGADLWKSEPDRYNYLSKVEPTMRSLDELNAAAWITGRRRDQGGERSAMAILEVDKSDQSRYKVNPLANWSFEEIWAYIDTNEVPYNPLHDRGYKSVGDYMTTAPVDQGAAERSGRFVGLGKTECGIHSTRKKIKHMREEAEKAGRDFEGTTSLPCPGCDYEISPETFDEVVFGNGRENYDFLLLEFYSPLCGGCQEFAPKFKRIAKTINQRGGGRIKTGRFDITEHDVPKSGADQGITIEATPDLYLIKSDVAKSGSTIVRYGGDGEHEVEPILLWLTKETGVDVG